MKKNRIKSPVCPNCQSKLSATDNFCPNCGQENDNKRQSFGKVMSDLITGFLSVDSRFTNSIPALLFRPGFLTKQFINGKRHRYLNPVRMFITIVVVYFLFASTVTTLKVDDKRSSTSEIIDSTLSSANQNQPAATDTNSKDHDAELVLDLEEFEEIKKLAKEGITDTDVILDTLGIQKSFWNRFWYSEIIKFAASDFDEFKEYLFSKLPWIIFMLMPVFALLLKLFYIRKKILYIDHLIFAFHLHSFVFLTGLLYMLITDFTEADPIATVNWILIIYTVLALKNVYNQSWIKTIFKLSLLSVIYFIAGLFSLLISMFVIFLIW